MKICLYCLVAFSLLGCSSKQPANKLKDEKETTQLQFPVYSANVKDSFTINVYLPDTTGSHKPDKFPVIYILDANLYFDVFVSIMKKYSEVGLLPPAILVGIGYDSFENMDSLRQRDYTYPVALAEYEMPVSGKADHFLDFLTQELVPLIDQKYPCNVNKRSIMGHSLGGYFAMYALAEALMKSDQTFFGFIAASPSLHYNHNYLLKQFDSIRISKEVANKAYVAFGALENKEITDNTSLAIDTLLRNLSTRLTTLGQSTVKTAVFSEMDHMDTQIPTFMKGLQWVLAN